MLKVKIVVQNMVQMESREKGISVNSQEIEFPTKFARFGGKNHKNIRNLRLRKV